MLRCVGFLYAIIPYYRQVIHKQNILIMKGGDAMIVVKVILIVLAVIFFLLTLWGIIQHFNLPFFIGDSPWDNPFPTIRLIVLLIIILLIVLL